MTRKRGSSSRTKRQNNVEDEDVEEVEAGAEKPFLSRDGLWFEVSDVVKYVSAAIRAHFDVFCPNWRSTPPHVRETWWCYFKGHFTWNPEDEAEVKEAFFDKCQDRLKDMMYRASISKNAPGWMGDEKYQLLLARKKDKKFLDRSNQAKANRRKHAVDGKALGTHTMGRMSALQQAERMALTNTEKKLPSAIELFICSKTKKGGVMMPKAKSVLDQFKSKKTQLQEVGAEINEDEIYYDVVGGRKKGRVYGVGSAAPMYYCGRNFTSSDDSPTNKGYSPGIVSQLQEKNAKLEKRLGEVEAWRENLMALLKKQFGVGTIDPTCGPNINLGPRDFDDNDGGSGSANNLFPVS